jgi:hypothetical protein
MLPALRWGKSVESNNHSERPFRQRLLSDNGDNPFSSWVDHPLSKGLTRISMLMGTVFLGIVGWNFVSVVNKVDEIGSTLQVILINQATEFQRLSNSLDKVREIERMSDESRRRLNDLERSLYAPLRPQGE